MPEHPAHQTHQTKRLRTSVRSPRGPRSAQPRRGPPSRGAHKATRSLFYSFPDSNTPNPQNHQKPTAPKGGGKRKAIKTRREDPDTNSNGPPKAPDSLNAISYVRVARYGEYAKLYRVSYLDDPTQQKV